MKILSITSEMIRFFNSLNQESIGRSSAKVCMRCYGQFNNAKKRAFSGHPPSQHDADEVRIELFLRLHPISCHFDLISFYDQADESSSGEDSPGGNDSNSESDRGNSDTRPPSPTPGPSGVQLSPTMYGGVNDQVRSRYIRFAQLSFHSFLLFQPDDSRYFTSV